MRRKIAGRIAALAILVLSLTFFVLGCSGGYIGANGAMEVAMKDLGLLQMNVSNLTAKLDGAAVPASYKVTFIYASQTYQYLVDAKTGVIMSKGVISSQLP